MHSRHKLRLDSNRNTKNIIVIKIAIEMQFVGENFDIYAFCWNMQKMQQHVKYTAITYSHKILMCLTISVISY